MKEKAVKVDASAKKTQKVAQIREVPATVAPQKKELQKKEVTVEKKDVRVAPVRRRMAPMKPVEPKMQEETKDVKK